MALPVSVSDMLKLLDKIPEWAGLKRMQARIDALEAKVAALAAQRAAADACPACGSALAFVSERPHPTFGRMGQRERTLKCSNCAYTTTRMVDTKVKG